MDPVRIKTLDIHSHDVMVYMPVDMDVHGLFNAVRDEFPRDNLAATVRDEHGNHVESFHLLRAVDATEDQKENTGTTLQWAGSSSEPNNPKGGD